MAKQTGKDERALIRSVVGAPDRDEPRLAYADWLDAQGRTDRARLIRVQCDIASLQAEEQALLNRHAREWGGPLLALGADRWVFHRGFPEEIDIAAHHFLNIHKKIDAITPVRHLKIGRMTDDDLAALAALPLFSQLRSLTIGSPYGNTTPGEFGLAGVSALAAARRLRDLQRLTIRSDELGEEAAMVVANSLTFANLTHLTLTDPVFNRAGSQAHLRILSSPGMARLQELQVGDTTIGPYALRATRDAMRPPGSPDL